MEMLSGCDGTPGGSRMTEAAEKKDRELWASRWEEISCMDTSRHLDKWSKFDHYRLHLGHISSMCYDI